MFTFIQLSEKHGEGRVKRVMCCTSIIIRAISNFITDGKFFYNCLIKPAEFYGFCIVFIFMFGY